MLANVKKMIDNKRILITGGTGSLGKVLLRRLLSGEVGHPSKIIVFSRDEAKQHSLRVEYQQKALATDEVIYNNFSKLLEFRIGDVRDLSSIASALHNVDIVFNAAALKQVPTCEYFPYEAVKTNIGGAENIVRAIREYNIKIETVIGVSTDKAVKPVNVMGMTKSVQERIFARANLDTPDTRFVLVRYGNVLASRGSVIPLFHEQIKNGGPVTITSVEMTRFLLSLEEAVDIILTTLCNAKPGETYIPYVPSARIIDVAKVLIGDRPIKIQYTGVRPGEKLHEILVSDEEAQRTIKYPGYCSIGPILPELQNGLPKGEILGQEYSSEHNVMSISEVKDLLMTRKLMFEDNVKYEGEFLR
jgi:FlaA1/EpsC-like NDP-sugar epimerase